jgi:type IV pilus assembly protein PilC
VTTFRYKARTADGQEVKGVVDGETVTEATDTLAEQQLTTLQLKEKRSFLQMELSRKKVAREDVMHFSRQLSAFVRSGVPILEAIDIFIQETGNATLRNVLLDISASLRGGDRFSDAVGRHRTAFPPFYVDMLQAAELTGHLDTVLEQISRYIERDLEARRKVRSALAYPLVIAGMAVVTVIILSVFVLPRFKILFKSLNANLPIPTRMLIAMSGFIGKWWWVMLAVFLVALLGLLQVFKTPRGRAFRDRMILRLPVIGEVARYAIIERFCRIFATMLEAGVSLPEAISVVGQGTNNVVYQRALVTVREEMLEGEGLSAPIGRTKLVPRSVTQMVRVGENTGTLDMQLGLAAVYFDQELDFKIKRLTTLFEPAVIGVMGLIVGFVAVALVSAMYGVLYQSGQIK